ncbi:MAG TPA: FRG domain-containing protein [Thermomicrobiales bacterium]|nr:FRG domain-containing protein [Thermomicrobiales bacterium]
MSNGTRDIVIGSWNDLNDAVYADAWQGSIGRFRSDFVFRGVSNAQFTSLTTGLMRLGGAYAEMEGHLLRNFRKYAHLDVIQTVPADSTWHWLAMAQHHGLPSRLLDWSYSPFVATHFATASIEQLNTDGLIWAFDYIRSREQLPAVLRDILDEENSNVFTAEMLQRSAATLTEFDRLALDDGHFVAFFEPPSLDSRIVNQYALFSLMSSPSVSLDEWLARHPELFRRIIIPAEVKWEIRDKLDHANITERVLFPGLDGLSSWLRRYYSPRQTGPMEAAPAEEQSTARGVPTEQ